MRRHRLIVLSTLAIAGAAIGLGLSLTGSESHKVKLVQAASRTVWVRVMPFPAYAGKAFPIKQVEEVFASSGVPLRMCSPPTKDFPSATLSTGDCSISTDSDPVYVDTSPEGGAVGGANLHLRNIWVVYNVPRLSKRISVAITTLRKAGPA
jgi:hypothetical protein